MHKDVPHPSFLWRLVSAGTLLTIITVGGLSAARGEDILQLLEEEMTAPPPEGAKVQPEGEGPPAGTNPIAEEEKKEEEPAPPAPWSLTDLWDCEDGTNVLKDNQWKIGGNIDQSFTANWSSPRDRFNGPVTWTDRSNEYQLNQAWLYFERATDTTKKDWDLGGRFDGFLGSNARFDTETGLENNISFA